jgi:hypothetical protein
LEAANLNYLKDALNALIAGRPVFLAFLNLKLETKPAMLGNSPAGCNHLILCQQVAVAAVSKLKEFPGFFTKPFRI